MTVYLLRKENRSEPEGLGAEFLPLLLTGWRQFYEK